MTPYIERDPQGDMTIRDADTNKAICYMPSTCVAAGISRRDREEVEAFAALILAAVSEAAK